MIGNLNQEIRGDLIKIQSFIVEPPSSLDLVDENEFDEYEDKAY